MQHVESTMNSHVVEASAAGWRAAAIHVGGDDHGRGGSDAVVVERDVPTTFARLALGDPLALRRVELDRLDHRRVDRPIAGAVGTPSIASTASIPSVTSPNTVCLPSSQGALAWSR